MYICKNCGLQFEKAKIVSELVIENEAPEQHLVCPQCESGNFSKIEICSKCNEHKRIDELEIVDGKYVCDECSDELIFLINQLNKKFCIH